MAITDKQVQQFRTQGFTIAPTFFDAREVRAIQAEVARMQRDGLLRNVRTEGDGKTHSAQKQNLQLCPMYHKSDLFRALPFADKVIDAVGRLIGEPFILHLDQIFLKPGRTGDGTSWHQDNSYFKISDPLKGTAMWVACHDATLANGAMRLIPGVFEQQFEHGRDPNSDHHIRMYPSEKLESTATVVEIPAGGVAFFCYGTPHCTGANTTDRERAGAAFHFLHADYAAEDLIAADREYRPYLTGPKASGGLNEYGVKVAGTWEQEVENAINGKPVGA